MAPNLCGHRLVDAATWTLSDIAALAGFITKSVDDFPAPLAEPADIWREPLPTPARRFPLPRSHVAPAPRAPRTVRSFAQARRHKRKRFVQTLRSAA